MNDPTELDQMLSQEYAQRREEFQKFIMDWYDENTKVPRGPIIVLPDYAQVRVERERRPETLFYRKTRTSK
jgi:hypothetical protein